MDKNTIASDIIRAENTCVVVDTQSQHDQLVLDIDGMLNKLEPPPSSERCIYRVPEQMRKLNEEAYTPSVVSIGPFHHGNEKLKSMELVKKRYFKTLVRRSSAANVSLKNYVELVKNCERRIRQCYSEIIEMDSHEFVTMILVDGCFIIGLLLNSRYTNWSDEENPLLLSELWLRNAIYFDMILLENQVPFFILEELFGLATTSFEVCSLLDITLLLFTTLNKQNKLPANFGSIKHLTDLVLMFYRPTSQRLPRRGKMFQFLPSATELNEAGVKFEARSTTCLHDIQFDHKRVLKIPCFTLDGSTEIIIRNLIALEICHYSNNTYIIDYFGFMDYLINTPSDIDLLIQNGIIFNCLSNSKEAADLLNNLCTNTSMDYESFYFSHVCEDLIEYYKTPMNKLKATLRRDYFDTPFKTASTIAAITLLGLTLIQTVCSIISTVHQQ